MFWRVVCFVLGHKWPMIWVRNLSHVEAYGKCSRCGLSAEEFNGRLADKELAATWKLMRRQKVGQQIVDALEEFARKLESGEEIRGTRVEIVSRVAPGAEECIVTPDVVVIPGKKET